MKISKSIAHIALALLLLLSQQLGVGHTVSHLSPQVEYGASDDGTLSDEAGCDECLAFSSVGAALAASSLPFPAAADFFRTIAAPAGANSLPRAHWAFDSRAPPFS